MKGKNVAIIGAGLAAVGALAWFFLQPKPSTCASRTTEADCTANGCYWYDGACHSLPKPPPGCSSYTNEADCAANSCYWYDGACHSTPQPPPGEAAEIISISAS